MLTEDYCYLCSSIASIEDVPSEGGERIDVLCKGSCPRYIISQTAIKNIIGNTGRQKEALREIQEINKAGGFPIVLFDAINKKLIYTSKQNDVTYRTTTPNHE